jgi:hypothetical protein
MFELVRRRMSRSQVVVNWMNSPDADTTNVGGGMIGQG